MSVTDLANNIKNIQGYTKNADVFSHIIYCVGDSLTFGTGVEEGYGYPTALESLLTGWNTLNFGISGQKTSDILLRFNSDILETSAEYVIIWAGINDINHDVSSTTIKSNLQAMYTIAHNAGIKVIALTLAPEKGYTAWSSARQSVIDEINTWINETALYIDHKIDTYSLLEDSGNADTLQSAYDSGDHLHLSQAGYDAVAGLINETVSFQMADFGELKHDSIVLHPIVLSGVNRQALVNSSFELSASDTSVSVQTNNAQYLKYWNNVAIPNGTPSYPTATISQQALSPNELPDAKYYTRISSDGTGSGFGDASIHSLFQRRYNLLHPLCGRGKKLTGHFYARSSVAGAKLGSCMIQNYGTGGSANDNLKGKVFELTNDWKKYTYTVSTKDFTGKTLTNESFAFYFVYQWGVTQATTYFTNETSANGFINGTIDIAIPQVNSGDVALSYSQGLKSTDVGGLVGGVDFLTPSAISTSTSLGTSNTLVPSQNAVKSYVDAMEDTLTSYADTKLSPSGNGSSLTGLTQNQISGLTTTSTANFASIVANTSSDTASTSAACSLVRKRVTDSIVQNGDTLGKFLLAGYSDASTVRYTGAIIGYASETWGASASGTELRFATTSNSATSRTERWKVINTGPLVPHADNTYSLGASGARPAQLWAATTTINTSDERQKEQITPLSNDTRFDALFNKLIPVSYKWKDYTDTLIEIHTDENGNEYEVEIPNVHTFSRLHHGMIAQQVEQAMNDCSITSQEFAGLIKDTDTGEYGLRYEEFIPMLIQQIQMLKQEIKELKGEV